MNAKAGKFEIIDDALYGPKDYMEAQGDKKLAAILSGNDTVFNMCAGYSPNIETAICVALQTNYAGWLGMKQVEGWMKQAV